MQKGARYYLINLITMVRIFDKNISKLLLPFLLNTSNKECCDLTMIFNEN